MATENNGAPKEYTDEQLQYVYENRRYVGTKETVGFVLWDAAQSLNINTYSTRFVTNIVKVDLGYQTIAKTINSVWDIVNDIFMAAIVEKTPVADICQYSFWMVYGYAMYTYRPSAKARKWLRTETSISAAR